MCFEVRSEQMMWIIIIIFIISSRGSSGSSSTDGVKHLLALIPTFPNITEALWCFSF